MPLFGPGVTRMIVVYSHAAEWLQECALTDGHVLPCSRLEDSVLIEFLFGRAVHT